YLATDILINIILILHSSGIPWDEVLPTLVEYIEAASQRIDDATEKLDEMTRYNSELKKAAV
ncbi:hypothetical protein NEUTE2DRAFT_60780, partial [Neurospora tetrasperma FGSC 2509]